MSGPQEHCDQMRSAIEQTPQAIVAAHGQCNESKPLSKVPTDVRQTGPVSVCLIAVGNGIFDSVPLCRVAAVVVETKLKRTSGAARGTHAPHQETLASRNEPDDEGTRSLSDDYKRQVSFPFFHVGCPYVNGDVQPPLSSGTRRRGGGGRKVAKVKIRARGGSQGKNGTGEKTLTIGTSPSFRAAGTCRRLDRHCTRAETDTGAHSSSHIDIPSR